MSCPNLCDDCETVKSCSKSGCKPKAEGPAPQVLQPLAPSPAERTEAVLIDGVAYTIPAAVAGEMLRLHMESRAAQPARAGGDAPDWRELAARVMDALAENQEHLNAECPEHVKCYPSWEHQARWLRWLAEMFRTGKPVGGGAGVAAVHAALAATPADVEREALCGVAKEVLAEVQRAMVKFPTWPTDPLHALAVLGEEFGELTKDMLQMVYEPHKTCRENVRKEAQQTAAMSLRLLASLDAYEYKPGPQHAQSSGIGASKEGAAA